MTMAKFDVSTADKLFICKPGVTSFDVKIDLYSDAKEHWLAGGAAMGFLFPLRAVAGDPRADGSIVEPFYFLRDGWKIRPQEANHTLRITGNIELDEGETGELIVPTLGGYTVLGAANTTNRGTLLSGSTDWTPTELAQIRHRLGIDGTAQGPTAVPSLARPGDPMELTNAERAALSASVRVEMDLNSGDLDTLAAGLATVAGYVGDLMARITEGRAANLDNLNETVSSRAATGDPMSLTTEERENIANALLDLADSIEEGFNLRQTIRLVASMLCGKSRGGPGNSIFKDLADKKDRIVTVADKQGNRTVMGFDAT